MCKYACALQGDGRIFSKLMAKKKMVYDGSSLMLWEGNFLGSKMLFKPVYPYITISVCMPVCLSVTR